MAQYYHIIGQTDQPIQAVTIEELRTYYPNITCVEASNGVQYVINPEDAATQFQTQQVTYLLLNKKKTNFDKDNPLSQQGRLIMSNLPYNILYSYK